MNTERTDLIRTRLATLEPLSLEIEDQSHLHAGHEGGKNGASHYRVKVVAACFAGLAPIARHRLVYDRLEDLIPYPIHALVLDAKAP